MGHKRMYKVSEVIPMVGGLFTAMDYDFAGSDLLLMDMMLQDTCGERLVSPFVQRLMPKFSDSKQLPDETLKALGKIILTQYKHKWDGWNELYHLKYDPIHNYLDSMEEKVSDLLSSSDQERSQSQTSNLETGTNYVSNEQQTSQTVQGTETVKEVSSVDSTNGITNSGTDTVTRTLALKDVKSINSDKTETFSDNTTDKTVTDGGITKTRTDNLKDAKIAMDSSTDIRSDNLHQQSTSSESSDTQSSNDNSVHAFNSVAGVVTAENSALVVGDNASQLATFTTTVHGAPSDSSLQASQGKSQNTSAVDNTGSQSTDHVGSGSDTVDHTGTQETVEANNSTVDHTVTGSKNTTITESGGETVDHTGTETTGTVYGKKVDNIGHSNGTNDTTTTSSDTTNVKLQGQTGETSVKDASQLANSQRLADSLATASRTRTVLRQGNIGNITTQTFILEQIDVLRRNFIQEVINDVKDFISVPIYQ